MANPRFRAYPQPGESEPDFRSSQKGYRTGSTPEQRKGNDPGYIVGYGTPAEANSAFKKSSLTNNASWSAQFPRYNGNRWSEGGAYNPGSRISPYQGPSTAETGEPVNGVIQERNPSTGVIPRSVLGRELGSRTPGANPSSFDYTGMQRIPQDSRLDPATPIYDPGHDMRTNRQGNTISAARYGTAPAGGGRSSSGQPWGTASVRFEAPKPPVSKPDSWQADIISKYPQIGVEGSEENKAFVDAFKQHGNWQQGMDTAHQVMGQIVPMKNAPGAGRSIATDTSSLAPTASTSGASLPPPPEFSNEPLSLGPTTAWKPIQGAPQASATPKPGYFKGIWNHLMESPDPGAEAARVTGQQVKRAVDKFRPY